VIRLLKREDVLEAMRGVVIRNEGGTLRIRQRLYCERDVRQSRQFHHDGRVSSR